MFLDLRAADTPDRFEADVCIVGAGAAGISLATALAGSKLRVLLLESGGMEFDAATQELYSGAMAGLEYAALDTARLRWLSVLVIAQTASSGRLSNAHCTDATAASVT